MKNIDILKAQVANSKQAVATDIDEAIGTIEKEFSVKFTITKEWIESFSANERRAEPSKFFSGEWIRYQRRKSDTSFSVDSSFTSEEIFDLADLVDQTVFFRLDLSEAKASAKTGKHTFTMWHNWKASQYAPNQEPFASFAECRKAAEEYFLAHVQTAKPNGELTAAAA